MPRYRFTIIHRDKPHEDPEGTVLADDSAARDYARRVIRELKEGGGYDDPYMLMLVTDAAGREILCIPFTEERRPGDDAADGKEQSH
jgi:hypothetical protein